MPLLQTSGNVTADGYGGGVAAVPNYIEDVFSTYLYNGNEPNSVTVNNGIDLSTKGGLVWIKARETAKSNWLWDTVRGTGSGISSNTTGAAVSFTGVSAFNTNGFTVGSDSATNDSTRGMVSWTFRKQPKFFDVVTYTGNGSTSARNITHNLGATPGHIIIKKTSASQAWYNFAKNGTNYELLSLNDTGGSLGSTAQSNVATSTTFNVGYMNSWAGVGNDNGATYVAYLFAHDAGGFGLTGTDNVISCGSFTTDSGGNATVNLGYEPQWLLMKNADGTNYNWVLMDTMRGWTANTSSSEASLYPNLSNAETVQAFGSPTATGFNASGWYATQKIIYIAIRRGPMKVPTSGTSVFSPVSRSGTNTVTTITAGFAPDFNIAQTSNLGYGASWWDKLRGPLLQLGSFTSGAEDSAAGSVLSYSNTAVSVGVDVNEWINGNSSSNIYANWIFQRAPSFSDVVCYSGNGSARTLSHNLAAVPELIIVKRRNAVGAWDSYSSALANTEYLVLNTTAAKATSGTRWNSTTPTSSVFSVGTSDTVNASGGTYVAYLFSTCAGVSKVGTYTGNGSTQTIDCGFGAGGVRFVLIKRTDSTGDWYVYDTARGMTTLTDPYLRINVQAAQTATLGSVTTVSTGFALNAAILAAINVSGGTYIFLAIA